MQFARILLVAGMTAALITSPLPTAATFGRAPVLLSVEVIGTAAPGCEYPSGAQVPTGLFEYVVRASDDLPRTQIGVGKESSTTSPPPNFGVPPWVNDPTPQYTGNETILRGWLTAGETISTISLRDSSDNLVTITRAELEARSFDLSPSPPDSTGADPAASTPCPAAIDPEVTLRRLPGKEHSDLLGAPGVHNDLAVLADGTSMAYRFSDFYGGYVCCGDGEVVPGPLGYGGDEQLTAYRGEIPPAMPEVGDLWQAPTADPLDAPAMWMQRYWDGQSWAEETSRGGSVLVGASALASPKVAPGDGALSVSWEPMVSLPGVPPVSDYLVRLSGFTDGSVRTYAAPGTERSLTIPDLVNGQNLYVRVAARNANGWSGYGEPSPAYLPPVPTFTTLNQPATVTYGDPATFSGTVTESDGDPIVDGRVNLVHSQDAEGPWNSVTTIAVLNGKFTRRLTRQSPGYYGVEYQRGQGLASDSQMVQLRVRADLQLASTLITIKRHAAGAVFNGQAMPAASGRKVTISRLVSGQWRVKQTTTTGTRGRYSTTVPVPKQRGRYKYRISYDAQQPYLDSSKTLQVRRS